MDLASMVVIGIQVVTLGAVAGCLFALKKHIRESTEETAAMLNQQHQDNAEALEKVVNEIKDHFEIHLNNISHDIEAIRTASTTLAEDLAKQRSLQELSASELSAGHTLLQDTLIDGLRKQQHQIQELGNNTNSHILQTSEQQRTQIQEDLAGYTEGLLKLADSSQKMLSTIIGHFNQLNKESATIKKATAALVNNQKSVNSAIAASRQSLATLITNADGQQQLMDALSNQDELVTRVDQLRRSIESDFHSLNSRVDQNLQSLTQRQNETSHVTREDITSHKIAIDDVRDQVAAVTAELNTLAEALLEALSAQGELLAGSIDQNQTTLYTELDSVRQEQQRLNLLSDDLRRLVQLLRVHNQQTLSIENTAEQLMLTTRDSRQYFSHGQLEKSEDLGTGDITSYQYDNGRKQQADTFSSQGQLKYRSHFTEKGLLHSSSEYDEDGKEVFRYHFDDSGNLTEKVRINYDASGMPTGEVSEASVL